MKSEQNIFHLNMLQLTIRGGGTISDLNFDTSKVQEIAVDYHNSCPDGSETLPENQMSISTPLPYDSHIFVLPEKAENCWLASALACGSYFTKPQQVILSYEMAEALYPDNPGKLIGKKLNKHLYRYGSVDLEIVGIFRQLDITELSYLNGCGADYDTMEFREENYQNVFYVNAAMLRELPEDEGFFRGRDQNRSCFLYFDSFDDRNDFYEQYKTALLEQGAELAKTGVPIDLYFRAKSLSRVLLPLALLIAAFTVLFFSELHGIEFYYNHSFVSVLEYTGYPKKDIIKQLTATSFWQFLRLFFSAVTVSAVISVISNGLNRRFHFVPYELFSGDPLMLGLVAILFVALTFFSMIYHFHRVQISSWYENLISTRDIL